jgi:DNA mismatch repair ATPase MutS
VQETIILREISQILTVGTLVDPDLIPDYRSRILLAFREIPAADGWHFACCFVDCSVGEFQFCWIANDTNQRTQLETLLLQLHPAEVLIEKVCVCVCAQY